MITSGRINTSCHASAIVASALVGITARGLQHVGLVARFTDTVITAVEVLAVAVGTDAAICATFIDIYRREEKVKVQLKVGD